MEAFLPYINIPTLYIFAVSQMIKAFEASIVNIDKYAPDGKTGSLTAILANITIGVKNGNNDAQNAIGVSGFFATVNIMKKLIMIVKISGI